MPIQKIRLFAGMAGLLSLQAGFAGLIVSRTHSPAQATAPAMTAPGSAPAADSAERRAYAETQKIVLSMMDSPTDVAFPEFDRASISHDGKGTFTVNGSYYVGFSPVPQERFIAKIKRKGDRWQCLEIDWH